MAGSVSLSLCVCERYGETDFGQKSVFYCPTSAANTLHWTLVHLAKYELNLSEHQCQRARGNTRDTP